jgi:DNA-binding transcriptional LysR family regulator
VTGSKGSLRATEAADVEPGRVRVFNSNSLATIRRLIRDGVGVAVLPQVVVREYSEKAADDHAALMSNSCPNEQEFQACRMVWRVLW